MWRVALAVAFFAVQGALVVTAGPRTKHAFGFRMFADFATMRLSLERRLASGLIVPVESGRWTTVDRAGRPLVIEWNDLVGPRGPIYLDVTLRASYGAATQRAILEHALDWALAHTPDDTLTTGLIAYATYRTNGHPPEMFTVERRR